MKPLSDIVGEYVQMIQHEYDRVYERRAYTVIVPGHGLPFVERTASSPLHEQHSHSFDVITGNRMTTECTDLIR